MFRAEQFAVGSRQRQWAGECSARNNWLVAADCLAADLPSP